MIADFLKQRNITITEAARRLGISRTSLSKIIHGKTSLTPRIAQRCEAVFGLSKEALLMSQATEQSKETLPTPVSSLCQSNPFFKINSLEIERWAEEIDTRKLLPQLIRILILSTARGIPGIDFPANEDSQRPGFDGKLRSEEPHPWIPLGDSYWEMGVNKNPKAKMDADIRNSLEKTTLAQRKKSTFVFVTPRRLKSDTKNLDALKAKYGWKNIRILDASALEQWVECSIEAQVWLLQQLKRDTAGIETLRMRANRWLEPAKMQSFAPVLFEELVNELSDRLGNIFDEGKKNLCSIAADSEGEACTFLFYSVGKLLGKKNYPTKIATKEILFFGTPGSVKAIPMRPNNIVAVTADETVKKKLLEHPNAHFIWIETCDYKRRSCYIALHPVSRDSLFKAARNMGLFDSAAIAWEKDSCGSITALRRTLTESDRSLYPAWTKNESDLCSLIPLLFAGAWETSDAYSDKDTVCELHADRVTKRSLEMRLSHFLNLENSPLWRESTSCGVKSKRDLFHICKPWIVRSDCQRFFSVVKKVLTAPPKDPNSFKIVPSNKKCLSPLLRKNLVDTLVLLARNAQSIQACESSEIEGEVARTVSEILEHWDKDAYNAYDDCLESFALAAPRTFLDFWEEQSELCRWMMRPVTNLFFEKSPRPAFLDALKILCWEEVTFERATRLLAHLASAEPDDNLGDKPSRLLQWIFSAYFVHTGVSTQTRIDLLKRLTEKDPNTFWEICLADCVNRPHVGSWNPPPAEIRLKDYRTCVDLNDRKAMLDTKIDLIFSGVFDWTSERVVELFDIFECLPDEKKDTVLSIARKWNHHATDAEREHLKEHIDRRIEYAFNKPGSNVSLTQIARLKQLCKTLTAKTDEGKLLFLFSPEAFHQAYRTTRDAEQAEKQLGSQRRKALNQWKDAYGTEGLLQLMAKSNVNAVQSMAWCCSSFLSDVEIANFICEVHKAKMEHTRLRKMLIGLLFTPREKVLRLLGQRLSEENLIQLLALIPPSCETARFVSEKLPTHEATYWSDVDVTELSCRNRADAILVAEKLLSADRADAAFEFTWSILETLPAMLLFKLLCNVGKTIDSHSSTLLSDASYEIEKAMQVIDASTNISLREKAQLEIMFSLLLVPTGCSNEPPLHNLVDYLLQEPGVLVNLIDLSYKSEMFEEEDEKKLLDRNRVKAVVHSLVVLNLDDQSPESKSKMKSNYRKWAESLIKIAEEKGIRSIVESRLGEILGRHNRWRIGQSREMKSSWFNPDYCEVLETVGTKDILRGFYCGLFNSIGVRMRTLNGDTERSIAESFRREVEATKSYPKVQQVFRALQNEFEQNAETEDENLRKMQRTRYLAF